jgi:Fe-S oxidoreductase
MGGLLGAVEMCNNNGSCRAFDEGVMCPSFRVTRDEQHLTRGRANTLRLALTGQLGAEAMQSDQLAEAMKLCVSCKACRRECPTGVDMAKMKIEVLAARADRHGVSRRESLIADLPKMARILSRVPWLGNARNSFGPLRRLMERQFGIASGRSLPKWHRNPFRDHEAGAAGGKRGDIMLLADTFNRYFEPENLRAALRVLRAAGYGVVMPTVPKGRPLCCGRTFLAAGMVDKARQEARRTISALAGDLPVLGLEPSCLLTLRDEFRSLWPGAEADNLAGRAMLLSEFLVKERPHLALKALPGTAYVHGHCHQKSFGAFPGALATMRRVPELTVKPIASSCCGMAGSFGYQAETQDVSRAMAEAGLLPAVRAAGIEDYIVADGTSCRHQIRDLSGREAIHSVRLLDRALA